MITRRAFLTALAALPLVGRWMPKAEPIYLKMEPMGDVWANCQTGSTPFYPTPGFMPFAELPATITELRSDGDRLYATSGDRCYEIFPDGTYIEL